LLEVHQSESQRHRLIECVCVCDCMLVTKIRKIFVAYIVQNVEIWDQLEII